MIDGTNISLQDIADSEAKIVSYLATKLPSVNLRKGTAAYDILVRGMSYIVTLLDKEAEDVRNSASVVSLVDRDDTSSRLILDNLMSNWFLERRAGGLSKGYIRLLLSSKKSITLDSTFEFTRAAFTFSPDTDSQIIITESAYTESEGGVYVDIPVVSTNPGIGGGLTAGSFSVSPAIPGLISATNSDKFSDIEEQETNRDFVERAKNSISLRGMCSTKSIVATINDLNITGLDRVEVIKAGNKEMLRDIIAPYGDSFTFNTAELVVNNIFHSLGKADVVVFSDEITRFQNLQSTETSYITLQTSNYVHLIHSIKEVSTGNYLSCAFFTKAKDIYGVSCYLKLSIGYLPVSDSYSIDTTIVYTESPNSSLGDLEFTYSQTNPYYRASSVNIKLPKASTGYLIKYSDTYSLSRVDSALSDEELSSVTNSILASTPRQVIVKILNISVIKNPTAPTQGFPTNLVKQIISEFIHGYNQSNKLSVTAISKLLYDSLYQYVLGVASDSFIAEYYLLDDRYGICLPYRTTDYIDVEDLDKLRFNSSFISKDNSINETKMSALGVSNRICRLNCLPGDINITIVG
jgi:hypothetical protein